jgi:hypothetical protein
MDRSDQMDRKAVPLYRANLDQQQLPTPRPFVAYRTADPFTPLWIETSQHRTGSLSGSMTGGWRSHSKRHAFAYNIAVKDVDGQYHTVRQDAHFELPVPWHTGRDAVPVLGPRGLGSGPLSHKLALAAFQDGIKVIVWIAENWPAITLSVRTGRRDARHCADGVRRERDCWRRTISCQRTPLGSRRRIVMEEGSPLAQPPRLRTIPLMTYLLKARTLCVNL